MPLHRNIYSFVYRGEDAPESKDVIWIHHEKRNDIQSAMIAEIWIKNKWEPLIWGSYKTDTTECCCCGSPFVREEGKASAAMREASNIAKGAFAFSAGHQSKALADHSVAIGSGLIADKPYQTVLGRYNNNNTNALFVIGIGDSEENRLNAIEIDAVGNVNIPKLNIPQAEKVWNLGSGEYSAELPGGSSASGDNSVAMGLDNVSSGDFSLASGIDSVASGKCGVAFGSGTKASGENTLVIGSDGEAQGKCSLVFGHRSKAIGNYSIAGGWASNAGGDSSVAIGLYANSNGDYSFCTGYRNQANGRYGFAANYYTVITNEAESAFGKYNKLNNNQIFSIGIGTSDSNRENALEVFTSGEVNIPNLKGYVKTELLRTDEDLKSVSLGYGATAPAQEAIAIGHNVYALGERSQAFGDDTQAIGYGSHSEGYLTDALGDESHAEGSRTIALGVGSHAEGYADDKYEGAVAGGDGSHAEGGNFALGKYSHAEGVSEYNEVEITYTNGSYDDLTKSVEATYVIPRDELNIENDVNELAGKLVYINYTYTRITQVTTSGGGVYTFYFEKDPFIEGGYEDDGSFFVIVSGAYGDYSHAEGHNCVASGDKSHAEGYDTTASGSCSHAEGNSTTASGPSSHATGLGSEASGFASFACGQYNQASGENSFAGGSSSGASGDNTFVFGEGCVADASDAFVTGIGNRADDQDGSFVCGQYNESKPNVIFSIGIGADEQHRKNAIEVLADGTIRFYNSGDGNYYTLQQIINAINS